MIRKLNTVAALLVLSCALPGIAAAQATADPYATVQVEHDSNIFRIPNAQALGLLGDSTLADTDEKYVVGTTGSYLWDLQKLTGTLEARKIDYNHFTDLDHYEYLGNVELDWKLMRAIDGILQFRQERYSAPFADRDSGTQLEVDTDRNIVGKVNFNVSANWRLETGVNFHTLDAPLQLYPDFAEHETGAHVGISYLGVANLTYGIGLDHLDGNYSHAVGVGPYSQSSALFKVNYILTGLSSLNGSVGYSRRDQSGTQGDVSAVTGNIGYTRQLTGKTSIVVQVTRAINSYVAAAGSEIDTTGTVGLTWNAAYKLSVALNAGYTRSTFDGQVVPGTATAGREDHSPIGSLNLAYQIARRVQIKGYYSRQTRDSNYELFKYNDTLYGIQIIGHWKPMI